ncbi:hypothetical protein SAMN05192558_1324 [Actinokineospora alba]|uniref:Uncharacterized protein n=1 Tax=Actinokineospora alba TaxID=504798 RepID=A0A1H0WR36_9PSEU|nr:hypothetical protein [Actinokineospora alba]TDP65450.1 hypothetical protein C8E96_0932 [Actinokineospora alba]SDH62535.1 hypothetical protein SAMN05421871_101752 [Actinokineospora alba]SDP92746.1 hypothetical protein SAMN05192558_1324 [Actinokineospora alba]
MNTLTTRLDAIRDHLATHPALPGPWDVSVNACREDAVTIQLQAHTLAGVASALLSWAATLTNVTASAWRAGPDSVHLHLFGALADGTQVKIFDGLTYSPTVFPDLEPGGKQSVGMTTLRAWAADGAGVAA